jgi:hypothetical protein
MKARKPTNGTDAGKPVEVERKERTHYSVRPSAEQVARIDRICSVWKVFGEYANYTQVLKECVEIALPVIEERLGLESPERSNRGQN